MVPEKIDFTAEKLVNVASNLNISGTTTINIFITVRGVVPSSFMGKLDTIMIHNKELKS